MGRRQVLPTNAERVTGAIWGKPSQIQVRDALFMFRIYIAFAFLTNIALLAWYIYVLVRTQIAPILFSLPFIVVLPLRILFIVIVLIRVRNPLAMGAMGTEDWTRIISSFDPHMEGKIYCALSFSMGLLGAVSVISQGLSISLMGRHDALFIASLSINALATFLAFAEPIYIMAFGVWRPLRRVARDLRASRLKKTQPAPRRAVGFDVSDTRGTMHGQNLDLRPMEPLNNAEVPRSSVTSKRLIIEAGQTSFIQAHKN